MRMLLIKYAKARYSSMLLIQYAKARYSMSISLMRRPFTGTSHFHHGRVMEGFLRSIASVGLVSHQLCACWNGFHSFEWLFTKFFWIHKIPLEGNRFHSPFSYVGVEPQKRIDSPRAGEAGFSSLSEIPGLLREDFGQIRLQVWKFDNKSSVVPSLLRHF